MTTHFGPRAPRVAVHPRPCPRGSLIRSSKAADACRRLFDAGRGEAVFTAWLYEGAAEPVPVPGGPVPDSVRDARIVELRRSGWTLAAIAEEVGMSSKAAVSNALSRIACELEQPGPPRVGVRGDGTSEDW